MAQKKNENKPGRETGRASEPAGVSREFDDAVTTEIPEVLAKALQGDDALDLEDVLVTDMRLRLHVDPEDDDALSPGFLLNNRFEIVELVHSGGMGHVYKAVDQRRNPDSSPGVHVGIKMMRPSVASDQQARLTLEREAAKAQKLSHPNIINIFDFDDHEGRFFLVMEWLEGESINALLRRTSGQPLAPGFAWPVINGAAAAVQYAHENHVVHADINPSNIFITDTRDIKLLDFGVARYINRPGGTDDDRLTWVTQTYASPEVLSGLPPVFEDDVFSLACVAYRLLSGKHPFGGAPSLVAKHKGVLVEPIPGLRRNEWQILRRALSYERADRPNSPAEFIRPEDAAGGVESARGWRARVVSALRSPLAAVAALVIAVGGLWFLQQKIENAVAPPVDPAISGEPGAAGTVDVPPPSPTRAILAAAAQALDEGRLVAPEEDSARALFREALVLEPDNPDALRGLRAISNNFVQEARDALGSDDPLTAYAVASVAFETDPANPAIDIVNELLAARGDGAIADARLAAATGDFELAAQQLSRAEQYEHISPAEIQSLRAEIIRGRQDAELLASLAVADSHIVAGRLTEPTGENAHDVLVQLQQEHGNDDRLLASMERLGERLLTRAAFAAAAMSASDATELLDAVDRLGVLAPEVAAARVSLATTAAATDTDVLPDPPVTEQQDEEPELLVADIELPAEETVVSPSPETSDATVAAAIPQADGEPAFLQEASPPAAPADAAPAVERKTVQEFGIERYVAPTYPRRARQRGISGTVDVGFVITPDGSTDMIQVIDSEPGDIFDDSAVKAVRRWRFEPRENSVRAAITLRFDFAP